MEPRRIAIVGAGIAGTSAALFLARAGHAVTLFERTKRIGPVGAGFLLQPSGQRVLQELKLLEAARLVAEQIDELIAYLPSGRRLSQLRYADLSPGMHALGVHRARLFEIIHSELSPAGVDVRLGCEVTDYTCHRDEVALFADHQPLERFDLLIVADGARSALRVRAQNTISALEYDAAALWCVGPCPQVRNVLFQRAKRASHLCGLLPVGGGLATLFWGVRQRDWPEIKARGFNAFRDLVVRFEPFSESVLAPLESFDQLVFTGFRHVRTAPCRDQNVVFIGDAAHASSPHLGQGVNLALTDARTLARCIGESVSFVVALASFHHRRRWINAYYSQLSRFLTPFFQSDSRILPFGRDIVLPLLWRTPGVRGLMLQTLAGVRR